MTETQVKQAPTIVGLPTSTSSSSGTSNMKRTRVLIVTIVLLGLLSIALLITVIVQATKTTANNDSKTEITDEIISAAAHQISAFDRNASSDLCTDFYSYACGTWQRTHPIQDEGVERTIIGEILLRRDNEIERLLTGPIVSSSARQWQYKIKTYYTECVDDFSRQTDAGNKMVSLIEDSSTINGWFLLDNYRPDDNQTALLKNQSVYDQMAHIQGDLGVAAIFSIRTRFDETDPSIKRLELYPNGLSMSVNDYLNTDSATMTRQAAYQTYITQSLAFLARDAGVFDANVGDRLLTIANDVFALEYFLAQTLKATPSTNRLTTMKLGDLSAELSFDFVRLMNHELDDTSIVNSLTEVYITNLDYFTNAFEYLSKSDDDPLFARIIHNYFRWRLMWTYMDDLSYDYVHAHRVYMDSYYGVSLHSSNEDYCTREVVRRFPLAIQRLYTMNITFDQSSVGAVKTLVDSLKDGFNEYINNQADWMKDKETKDIALEKVKQLISSVGFANIASSDELLDNYYEKFIVNDASHFENSFLYHRFRHWTLSNSIKNPDVLDHWDLFETRTDRLFDYVALFNRLFITAPTLKQPLYNTRWPATINYGSLGVLLAQKLFASIDLPEGSTHLVNGTRVSSWWSSATSIAYNNSRNCITSYYTDELKTVTYQYNGQPIQVRLTGEPFSPTTLRHIGALRLAYNAVSKLDEFKSSRMPGTNLDRDQTFFLAYGQTQCFQRDGLSQLLSTVAGVYDERTALNTALIHMPEFSKAFNCPIRENKCF